MCSRVLCLSCVYSTDSFGWGTVLDSGHWRITYIQVQLFLGVTLPHGLEVHLICADLGQCSGLLFQVFEVLPVICLAQIAWACC